MQAYTTGDRVVAVRELNPGIRAGTIGRVTHDSPASRATVRVKFNGDPSVNYRICAKSDVRPS